MPSALDIADLRTCAPEKLQVLRPDDRKQVLRAMATDEEIAPKRETWVVHGKDVRFLGYHNKPIGQLADPNTFERATSHE